LFGAAVVIALSSEISWITFGDRNHTSSICLLSLAVLFQVIAYGQNALVQGMRRIKDLARMNVLGALYGTVISIPVIYFLRDSGVVISLVIVSGMMLVTSSWYSRQFKVEVPLLTFSEVKEETVALMKLGSVFMIGTLLLTAVAYIVRTLILRKEGLHAAGLYQSAWTLGGLYVSLIIQSMAADFYPRLTAAATDDLTCNRLVNEQVRVGMLLACPGVIATISLAPLVTAIFYSAQFAPAVAVLRWICLGTMLQVITWPMGFIIVAKGKKRIFFYCELACALTYAALAWVLVNLIGLSGAGIAFFGYCIFHGLLHYPIVNRISGFRWSDQNVREGILLMCSVAIAHVANYLVPAMWAAAIGSMITLICGVYSIRVLISVSTDRKIPKPFEMLLGLARKGESRVP
jgi:antigen flippase